MDIYTVLLIILLFYFFKPLIIITIILIIAIWIYFNYFKEDFSNISPTRYKSTMVTPQPMVYDKLTLYTINPDNLTDKLAKNIQNIYPIDKITPLDSSNDILQKLEKSTNTVGIVQDEPLQQYNNPDTDMRLICTIGMSSFVLIVNAQSNKKTWSNFTDKSYVFATDYPNSASDLTLQKILQNILNQYTHKVVYINYNENSIFSSFKNNIIDAYFIIKPDPDDTIQKLFSLMPVYLIGTKGLDDVKLSILFPNAKQSFIDGNRYNKKIYGSIPTFIVPYHLLASNSVPGEYIRILIRSLFENFVLFKSSGDNLYIQQMFEFNPQYLYPNHLNPIRQIIHPGAKKYFDEIGVITNNSNKDCIYTIGIDKCKNNLYVNPYRLML
jgi:TRAP-type uncharacterized transport system substrate-binding protein